MNGEDCKVNEINQEEDPGAKTEQGDIKEADVRPEDAAGVSGEEQASADSANPDDQEHSCQAGEEAQEESKKDGDKKGFFKKKKDPRDDKIEELNDRLRRTMAEFDNFRKRTEKEKATMYEMGARDIIEKMLPIVDNFERGLASIPDDEKGTPLADGMEKIYKQFQKTLEDLGVKAIEAVGQPFNPDFHNAVMHIEDENLGENVVASELQKGYMYRDSVVRHSMVQVAN